MNVSEQYSGSRGEDYARLRQSDPSTYGYAIDFAYFAPYLNPSDALLDFGCGNGGILSHAAGKVARAEGLEVNPASAKVARERGLVVHPGTDALPGGPTYDVVISNHVLEHVRDVCATLERLRRCLVPGGRIVLKLPIDDPRTAHQRAWTRDDPDHHLQTWTPRLLANLLFETGFDVQECRVVTSAWHPKLFPFVKLGLGPLLFWLLAVVKSRRQVLAVATNPG